MITKLSAEQEYLLKVAMDTYEVQKEAKLMDIPFIQNFAGKVSDETMNLWRRSHVQAMRSTTAAASNHYSQLANASAKATGEGKIALDGIQRIIRHVHPIDAPRHAFNAADYAVR